MGKKVIIDKNFSLSNPIGLITRLLLICLIKVSTFLVNSFFFLLPLGVYIVFMQFASKMISVNAINAYIKQGEFMFVYPNTVLVTTDANLYKRNLKNLYNKVDKFVEKNQRIINLVFGILVLFVLALIGVSMHDILIKAIIK